MDILQMAKQLGEAIAESKEMQELKEAEAVMMQDPGAKEVYRKYTESKFKKQQAELLNKNIPADYTEIENRARKHPLLSRLISCQEAFNGLIRQVNAVMTFAIENAPVNTGCFRRCHGNCGKCMEGVFNTGDGYTDDKTIHGD